jgi:hypothetical protein
MARPATCRRSLGGADLVRGGAGAALVGSHEEIANRIEEQP